jgi:hypothetical protein
MKKKRVRGSMFSVFHMICHLRDILFRFGLDSSEISMTNTIEFSNKNVRVINPRPGQFSADAVYKKYISKGSIWNQS